MLSLIEKDFTAPQSLNRKGTRKAIIITHVRMRGSSTESPKNIILANAQLENNGSPSSRDSTDSMMPA